MGRKQLHGDGGRQPRYLGVGPRIVILDISDPDSPTRLGQTIVMPTDPPARTTPMGFAVRDQYLYVAAAEGGLHIFDVTDPAAPLWASRLGADINASSVAVGGDYAYIADYDHGGVGHFDGQLVVVNIADPYAPVIVGTYPLAALVTGVALVGQHVFVSNWCGGLDVIDVSRPDLPQLVAHLSDATIGCVSGIAVAEQYVYLACDSDGLQVVDITEPTHPVHIGGCPVVARAENVRVSGQYAYVADRALTIVDISDPAAPFVAGSLTGYRGGMVQGLDLAGLHVILADMWFGTDVIDVSTPAAPARRGHYDEVGHVQYLAVADRVAYLTGYGKTQVIDVRDPRNPARLATMPHEAGGELAAAGHFLYVPGEYYWQDPSDVLIFDVEDPAQPVEVGRFPTYGYPYHLAVDGVLVYIPDASAALKIGNVADPSAPFIVGAVDTPRPLTVAYDSGYVYLGTQPEEYVPDLVVVDVRNPASPAVVTTMELVGGYPHDMAIRYPYLYLCNATAPVEVLDISNPHEPVCVGSYTGWYLNNSLDCLGDFVIVANSERVAAFDVHDPAEPLLVGSTSTTGRPSHVTMVAGYAYIADFHGGFTILAVHVPGDLNCDGLINAFDIDPFVLALTDADGYAAAHPDCHAINADCNSDGVVNAFDIDPFVLLLTGR